MYSLASKLDSLPIISLQTGDAVAWVKQPIIDMATLQVIAFRCETLQQKQFLVLMTRDIRQLAADCIIIDSEDELSDPGDIVRLKSFIEANFSPIDKLVITESDQKLGSVEDYTINLETNRVQKLHVRQSLLKSWLGASLSIDRAQITDVTPRRIVVRDATIKAQALRGEPLPDIHP